MTAQNTSDDARSGHPSEPNCSHCGAFNIHLWECCSYVRDDGSSWNPHYCSQVCQRAEWLNTGYVDGGHHTHCTSRRDDGSVEAEEQQNLLDTMPEERQGGFGNGTRCECPACMDFCHGCDECEPH